MTPALMHLSSEVTTRVTGVRPADPEGREKFAAALRSLAESVEDRPEDWHPVTDDELFVTARILLWLHELGRFDPDDGTDYALSLVAIFRKAEADVLARISLTGGVA